MADLPKFSAQHYNAIAKDIREELTAALNFYDPGDLAPDKKHTYYAVDALVKLALRLCDRFRNDNERFEPMKFLDACSPDSDRYPLSELWEA